MVCGGWRQLSFWEGVMVGARIVMGRPLRFSRYALNFVNRKSRFFSKYLPENDRAC